jgi:hypothetical protein
LDFHQEAAVRIHEGDYAYDVEQLRDPLTEVRSNWKFTISRVRPVEKILSVGEAATRAEAERKARQAISSLLERERKTVT